MVGYRIFHTEKKTNETVREIVCIDNKLNKLKTIKTRKNIK